MSKHTPGRLEPFILDKPLADIPAYVEQCIKASGGANFYFLSAVDPDLGRVDVAHVGNGPRGEANARRLAACWNACEGAPTEWLEQNKPVKELADAIREAQGQRDELLEALQAIMGVDAHSSLTECEADAINAKARAAIAKVTGEQT